MLRRASLVASVLILALSPALPRAQSKRFITETDLFKFTWIADPQISPDGSRVAFVRVTVNEKENRYETSLFEVASSGSSSRVFSVLLNGSGCPSQTRGLRTMRDQAA